MISISDFEGVSCAADVPVLHGLVAGIDSGFINNVVCLTVAFQWTFRFVGFVAIAGGFFIFLGRSFEYFRVMALDYVSHVTGAGVAEFYGVSVQYFVEFAGLGEMFADKIEECFSEVGGYSIIVGWIVPYDVSLSVFAFGSRKGFVEVKLGVVAAGLER